VLAAPVAGQRWPAIQATLLGAIPLAAAAAITFDLRPQPVVSVLLAVTLLVLVARRVFTVEGMLVLTLCVILFVPINRYTLPVKLPIDLEPYRIVVALLILAWLAALLVNPSVRLARSGFGRNVWLVLVAALASDVMNHSTVSHETSHVVKGLSFLVSYLVVFVIVVSVVRSARALERCVELLVGGGALIAVSAVVERRTGYNVFDHLHSVVPVLQFQSLPVPFRGGAVRAFASSQHPIELSAVLVCLLPVALYLCGKGQRRWWLAATCLAFGALSTASRTGIVMLIVVALVFAWLRPQTFKRLWPALIPALAVLHLVVPGAIGEIRATLTPGSGLIASQHGSENIENGRLSHYYRARLVLKSSPLFGNGFETRITGNEANTNSPVFDNQWLGTLVDTGLLGVLAWASMFGAVVRRFALPGKRDPSDRGRLLVCVSASLLAFGAGMFFFDAFSFTQATFLFWILLGLGAVATRLEPWGRPEPS
jgi:O-antigen ligase